jgi:hypothetical protein
LAASCTVTHRVLVAAGTLVRAAHCIIEQIGRSGCEAENGGVREVTRTVFQPCDSRYRAVGG